MGKGRHSMHCACIILLFNYAQLTKTHACAPWVKVVTLSVHSTYIHVYAHAWTVDEYVLELGRLVVLRSVDLHIHQEGVSMTMGARSLIPTLMLFLGTTVSLKGAQASENIKMCTCLVFSPSYKVWRTCIKLGRDNWSALSDCARRTTSSALRQPWETQPCTRRK